MLRFVRHGIVLLATILTIGFTSHSSAQAFSIDRIQGDNRYETAVEISRQGFQAGASTVVIARGNEFADALAGAPLAKHLDAPLLLSKTNKLPEAVQDELNRLKPDKVILLGGPNAISEKIRNQLVEEYHVNIRRIAGDNRYTTASRIADAMPSSNKAVVVNGSRFPDAMAAAPFAAKRGYPILLTKKTYNPGITRYAVGKVSETYIIGGEGVVDQSVERDLPNPTRISGDNRYETSAEVLRHLPLGRADEAYVVTGEEFADGIAGAVLAANNNDNVMLVEENYVPNPIKLVIDERGFERFIVLGGYNAVDQYVDTELKLPIQLLLVNKQRGIPASYEPARLVEPDVPFPFSDDREKRYMSDMAAGQLEKMFNAAWNDGVELYAQSGFRSYERQKEIHEAITRNRGSEYADRVSAEPGHSEHQTGLAMDVTSPEVNYRLIQEFASTEEGRWVQNHAADYGFIIRYPKGREKDTGYTYEPWHLRYVGISIAQYMDRTNRILEEYLR
ncbi:cell wall-binding repeat-containing protein [Pontibacillus salicampi]|uniref:Cell wall-binding repeat-containing protein n=1 Tax=Pontibacillus salicampi TaxID=1449801 RepID=A0ABV6LQD0_9BACI